MLTAGRARREVEPETWPNRPGSIRNAPTVPNSRLEEKVCAISFLDDIPLSRFELQRWLQQCLNPRSGSNGFNCSHLCCHFEDRRCGGPWAKFATEGRCSGKRVLILSHSWRCHSPRAPWRLSRRTQKMKIPTCGLSFLVLRDILLLHLVVTSMGREVSRLVVMPRLIVAEPLNKSMEEIWPESLNGHCKPMLINVDSREWQGPEGPACMPFTGARVLGSRPVTPNLNHEVTMSSLLN